ncbi:NRAMP family divalent metal transporter [Alicyclobacillus mengziensis]|nr:divalent metal cation transporter [Alicyclobacillus mengziensis]
MSRPMEPGPLIHEINNQKLSPWMRLIVVLMAFGPGLMVMLADTDAGSIITAAQSGASWGYRLLLPQVLLIPVLYVVQEMTIRLGIGTGQGHGELIRKHFGLPMALLSVGTLFLASVGALVTEFAGIAGVGDLFGVPKWFTVLISTALLVGIGMAGSYRRFERIGLAVGLLEVLFIPAAWLAHPDIHTVVQSAVNLPLHNSNYLFLLAANIGAVIMPWMVFYQQGAVIDKHLSPRNLRFARLDTFLGSIVTQVIMIAVMVAVAATIGKFHPDASLNNVAEIVNGVAPVLGQGAKWLFSLAFLGASFLASLVVSVAGAWGIGEAFHLNHSLNSRLRDAKWFYIIYSAAHVGGAIVVLSAFNLVRLTIDVEVMNAMLLPIVLGFLLALEAKALPPQLRMKGWYRYTAWAVSGIVMLFGVYMAAVTVT